MGNSARGAGGLKPLTLDPVLLDELARVFAEAAVRAMESEKENAVGLGGHHDGVEDEHDQHTSRQVDSVFPRADA